MAGDRGLAFVVIGIIGMSLLWSRVAPAAARENKTNSDSLVQSQFGSWSGATSVSRVGQEMKSDYRILRDRVKVFAAMNGTSVDTPLLQTEQESRTDDSIDGAVDVP